MSLISQSSGMRDWHESSPPESDGRCYQLVVPHHMQAQYLHIAFSFSKHLAWSNSKICSIQLATLNSIYKEMVGLCSGHSYSFRMGNSEDVAAVLIDAQVAKAFYQFFKSFRGPTAPIISWNREWMNMRQTNKNRIVHREFLDDSSQRLMLVLHLWQISQVAKEVQAMAVGGIDDKRLVSRHQNVLIGRDIKCF